MPVPPPRRRVATLLCIASPTLLSVLCIASPSIAVPPLHRVATAASPLHCIAVAAPPLRKKRFVFCLCLLCLNERLGLQNRIQKKKAYPVELEDQYVGLQNLIERNKQLYGSGNAPSGGVALPFILVQTRPHATVEVEISIDMQLVHFDFNSTPFELHNDNYEIVETNKLREAHKVFLLIERNPLHH